MEIRVQSIKFNADQKLLDFIDKKFSRIEKFYDAVTGVDVALSLLPDHENKNVKVQVSIPGRTIVVEKNAKTFEDAVVDCADILKEKLVKEKYGVKHVLVYYVGAVIGSHSGPGTLALFFMGKNR